MSVTSGGNRPGAAEPAPYYADLDAARGLLMALGIVIHAANIYSPGAPDVIPDPDGGVVFTYIAEAAHLFRMPAFFLISGFFCAMSLEKYGAARVLRARSLRLLLPLAATALTFNAAALWLLAHFGAATPPPPLSAENALAEFASVNWLLHLWFLAVLFVYVAIAALLFALTRRGASDSTSAFSIDPLYLAPLFALLSYGAPAIGAVAGEIVFAPLIGGLKIYTLLEYAPYFAVGYYLFSRPEMMRRVRRYSTVKIIVFSVVVLVWPLELLTHWMPDAAEVGFFAFGSWLATLTSFPIFVGLVERLRFDARAAAQASYTVYLTHFLLVTAFSALASRISAPPGAEFALIVAATLMLTLLFHFYVVQKSPLLTLLFNGRRIRY